MTAPKRDHISEWAAPLLERGAFAEVFSGLERFEREHLDDAELLSWYELRGVSAYRSGKRQESLRAFEEGVSRFPAAGTLRFGYGQELEALGNIDGAVEQWRQVGLSNSSAQHVLAIARYLYLWDRFEEARDVLAPIFEAYYKLRIMDDTFLFIRGLPDYGTTFQTFAGCAVLDGAVDQALSEIERAAKRLSDYDFAELREVVLAHRDGDWRLVLASDEKAIARWGARLPVGRQRLRRAAILSRAALDLSGAMKPIDEFAVASNDHAWLADVQTLLRAEAAHRFGERELEQAQIALLMERQPLLFEPQWAFEFGFLRYQEKLKPEYRRRKRPR